MGLWERKWVAVVCHANNTQTGSQNWVKSRERKQDLARRPDLCPPSLVSCSEFPRSVQPFHLLWSDLNEFLFPESRLARCTTTVLFYVVYNQPVKKRRK